MNEQEYLLTVLAEECSEVTQESCKALRFGLHDINPSDPTKGDNKRRMERELAELLAVAEMLGLIVRDEDKASKVERLKKFMDYSRKRGTLI
jgi:NTP pyrophosphatase (non-canonical NTP hydrolase)